MKTFADLILEASTLPQGATLGDHLLNLDAGGDTIIEVTAVKIVEGINASMTEEEEYVGAVVAEDEVMAVVMEEEIPVGSMVDDEEPMTGIMVIEDEIAGVLEDC